MSKITIKDLHAVAKKYDGVMQGSFETEEKEYNFIYSEVDKALIFNTTLVRLDSKPCNYGGERYWFLCPYCNKRKTALYSVDDTLLCGQCLNMEYNSLNRTKTDSFYYYEQAKKVAMKIDSNFEWNGWQGNGAFPDKPKGMHQVTYNKLEQRYNKYWYKGQELFMNGVSRVLR